jgi:ferric-dicitrate binding protein FerR (iron transport regulator)
MGQAKRRGSFDDRVGQAQERERLAAEKRRREIEEAAVALQERIEKMTPEERAEFDLERERRRRARQRVMGIIGMTAMFAAAGGGRRF